MLIVNVTLSNGVTVMVRDPVRIRKRWISGVRCNEFGVGMRTEGCAEDAEMLIHVPSIVEYKEFVL